jgi:predicted ATPase/DNA-binding CsgD family transcriptional regulator
MRADAGNLPQEVTSFIGRRHEVAEVRRLLAESRLVTLAGVGGVGKTRLALQVAAAVRRSFPQGLWLVELDQVRDEALLAPAVTAALGIQGGSSPVTALTEYLAERQLLLVLDTCEHLVSCVAKLADALLRGVGDLRILATSREPLEIDGEAIFPVQPLGVPPPGRPATGDLAGYEAVALFVERAAAIVPGFALTGTNQATVGDICARLDGLPLAIELAVSRLRVLSPEQLRDRLAGRLDLLTRGSRTAPDRQQTLRASIEWSHDLCTPAEQRLWARLSVFNADVDLATVEGVCADDELPAHDMLNLVASLVDKSILTAQEERAGTLRYRMLDTIREYGRDRLRASGEEAVAWRRHRDWHRRLVHQAAADLIGPRHGDWQVRLNRKLPDIRAALRFSLAEPDGADVAITMIADLTMQWIGGGMHSEGRHWLDLALARPGSPTHDRVRALFLGTALAAAPGDVPAAERMAQQAHDVAVACGDARSRAVAAMAEATLATARGDLATAAARGEDALGVFRAFDDVTGQVFALNNLVLTKVMLDDEQGAIASHDAMVEICRPREESRFAGFAAMALGIGQWRWGNLDRAADQMAESLRLLRRSMDTLTTCWALEVSAWVAAGQGRHQPAAVLLGAAAGLAESMGSRAALWSDLLTYHDHCEGDTRQALGEPAFRTAFARGQELTPSEAVGFALGQPIGPAAASAAGPPETGGDHGPLGALTPRERDVAALIAQGLTNKEIATRLVISRRTAEGHVENIMMKLGCTSRVQVASRILNVPGGDASA